MEPYVVETKQLCKSFRGHQAVSNVEMKVKKGAIYGFIGRNGAGKSTTLKMICGLTKPTSGEIILFQGTRKQFTYKSIGALIEQVGAYPDLSAMENMMLKATGLGLQGKAQVQELLTLVSLGTTGSKPVRKFSVGMKQRLGIALALLGNPDLLILDEPINGLDPEGIREIRNVILQLNAEKGITMIISSHILGELGKIATDYGIIKDGVLIEQISKEALEDQCKSHLYLQVNDVKKASVLLEQLKDYSYEVRDEQSLRIFGQPDRELIGTLFMEHGIVIQQMYEQKQDLESYFLSRIGGEVHA